MAETGQQLINIQGIGEAVVLGTDLCLWRAADPVLKKCCCVRLDSGA